MNAASCECVCESGTHLFYCIDGNRPRHAVLPRGQEEEDDDNDDGYNNDKFQIHNIQNLYNLL